MTAKEKANYMLSVSATTEKSRCYEWVKNAIANEQVLKTGLKTFELHRKLENMPVIIVGAGPSLDKNKEYLKQAKGRAFIVVADTAYNAIKDIVKPDAVVTLEANTLLLDLVDFEETEGIILFADITSQPEVINKWKGNIYWYTTGFNGLGYLNEMLEKELNDGKPIGRITPGGCVVNAGFSLVKEILYCDPVILIGCDFGFDNPGKHHCGIQNDLIPENHQVKSVEGIFNNESFSTDVLTSYRYWLEGMVKLKNPQGKLDYEGLYINATEGGTLKDGWNILTLKTVVTKYLKDRYDFSDIKNIKKLDSKNIRQKTVTTFSSSNDTQEVTSFEED